MEFDFVAQEKRFVEILGNDIVKSENSIIKYQKYLLEHLEFPVKLTGNEDFPWEGFYVFGSGNSKEYEKLKEENPSYTDLYNLISFSEDVDAYNGILAIVVRVSDSKEFELPLADLEAVDSAKNHLLLDDYTCWCVNH